MDIKDELVGQLDLHWRTQLRPRLDGLTDDEYFWQPVPGCWTVHRDGGVDFEDPPPQPVPVTTIAWRMAHIIIGVLAMRSHSHFGGPPAGYASWPYATDADTALRQLDEEYARWIAGVRGLDVDELATPVGSAEGQWAAAPMATLILHINREVIHHGAEICLLRDLFMHTNQKEN
jgi:hypothetical protein